MRSTSRIPTLALVFAMVNSRIFAFAPKAPMHLYGGWLGQEARAREMRSCAKWLHHGCLENAATVLSPRMSKVQSPGGSNCATLVLGLKGGTSAVHPPAFPGKLGQEAPRASEIHPATLMRYRDDPFAGVGDVNLSSSAVSSDGVDSDIDRSEMGGAFFPLHSSESSSLDLRKEALDLKQRLRDSSSAGGMKDHEDFPPARTMVHCDGDSAELLVSDLELAFAGKASPAAGAATTAIVASASQETGKGGDVAAASTPGDSKGGRQAASTGGGGAASGGGGSGGGKRKPPFSSAAGAGADGDDGEGPREKRRKGEASQSNEEQLGTERAAELAGLKVVELKELCRRYGLRVAGKKVELAARIAAHEAGAPPEQRVKAASVGGGTGEEAAVPGGAAEEQAVRPSSADAGEAGMGGADGRALAQDGEKSRPDSAASQQEMLSDYDPAEEAAWAEGEAVPFAHLASTLDKISETRKRLEIQAILTNAVRSVLLLEPADLIPFVYITLSRVAPAHEGLELGVGDSVLLQAVAQASGSELKRLKEEYKKSGDLGLVAAARTGGQQTLVPVQKLTLRSVFAAMKQVAATSGKDAVKARVGVISGLLVAASPSEAKWIVRALQGKLRVGLQEPTVIVALATAVVMNPPKATGQAPPPAEERKEVCAAAAEALKAALAVLPCYDTVLQVLLAHPYTELERLCPLTPGVPVKPMLAHPSKGVEEVMDRFGNRSFTCEFKYDGERAQRGGAVKIFSRNSEDTTAKFPDLVAGMGAALAEGVEEAVVDCEVVAFNASSQQILPFQTLSTRARKNVVAAEIKVEVRVFAFDLLFLNGRATLPLPLLERRRLLRASLRETATCTLVTCQDTTDPEAVGDFLLEAVQEGCEGLMVKGLDGPHAVYEPDKRSREWLKIKKDYIAGMADSFDLVLVAAWRGRGKRTGLLGAFLLACVNPDKGQFETVCRLGTGFSDQQLANFSAALAPLAMPAPAPDLVAPAGPDQPDVWFHPEIVWEVEAADLSVSPRHTAGLGAEHPSRGIALRFPRFLRVREDKDAQSATQTEQVLETYRKQAALSPAAQKPRDSASEADSE